MSSVACSCSSFSVSGEGAASRCSSVHTTMWGEWMEAVEPKSWGKKWSSTLTHLSALSSLLVIPLFFPFRSKNKGGRSLKKRLDVFLPYYFSTLRWHVIDELMATMWTAGRHFKSTMMRLADGNSSVIPVLIWWWLVWCYTLVYDSETLHLFDHCERPASVLHRSLISVGNYHTVCVCHTQAKPINITAYSIFHPFFNQLVWQLEHLMFLWNLHRHKSVSHLNTEFTLNIQMIVLYFWQPLSNRACICSYCSRKQYSPWPLVALQTYHCHKIWHKYKLLY